MKRNGFAAVHCSHYIEFRIALHDPEVTGAKGTASVQATRKPVARPDGGSFKILGFFSARRSLLKIFGPVRDAFFRAILCF